MKNIMFYSISLSLVGLMCCYDEANEKLINSLYDFASDEIENMSNFPFINDFGSDISPSSNFFKTIYFKPWNIWNKTIEILNQIFNNSLMDNTTSELDKNTAKRITRNANMDDGSLAQSNITKVQQNISMSTESVLSNKVTENQTQPHINYSLVTNSTPGVDFLSTTFINTGPLINNNIKQKNNTNVNKTSYILYSLSTWPGFKTIKEHMHFISIIVSCALLLLFLGIMQFVVYRAHRFRNLRREINQHQEILL